ncbi:Desiccation protectant protein Lea14 homolog [Linum grandiflorum]
MADLFDQAKNLVAETVGSIPKPEATVTDVDLNGVRLDHIEYVARVSVDNPYPTPIPISEISYNLKSSTRVIAHGTVPDPGSLKANGKTDLNVIVKVPHTILVSLVADITRDWDIDYELDLGLVIDLPVLGTFTIPISSKGEIKLPTFSNVFSFGNNKE